MACSALMPMMMLLLVVGHVEAVTRDVTRQIKASPLPSNCVDKLSNVRCTMLLKYGACLSKTKAMRLFCPLSCGFCGANCKDAFAAKCSLWLRHGTCHTHPQQMREWCRKGCGYCKAQHPRVVPCKSSTYGCCWDGRTQAKGPNWKGCGECRNWFQICDNFTHDCHSERNKSFMKYNCPKTCGLCDKGKRDKTLNGHESNAITQNNNV